MLAAPVKEAEENKPADDDFPYIGYMEGSSGIGMKLYVEKGPKKDKAEPDNRRVVYCFNKTKAWPDTFDNTKELAYKKQQVVLRHLKIKLMKNLSTRVKI